MQCQRLQANGLDMANTPAEPTTPGKPEELHVSEGVSERPVGQVPQNIPVGSWAGAGWRILLQEVDRQFRHRSAN